MSTITQRTPPTKAKSVASSTRSKSNRYHCQSCALVDTDEMVQCDECDEWHHYSCVNVTHDVAKMPWSCVKCIAKGQSRKGDTSAKSGKSSSRQSTTTALRKSFAELELSLLDEEKTLAEKRDTAYLKKKRDILLQQLQSDSVADDNEIQSDIDRLNRTTEWVEQVDKNQDQANHDSPPNVSNPDGHQIPKKDAPVSNVGTFVQPQSNADIPVQEGDRFYPNNKSTPNGNPSAQGPGPTSQAMDNPTGTYSYVPNVMTGASSSNPQVSRVSYHPNVPHVTTNIHTNPPYYTGMLPATCVNSNNPYYNAVPTVPPNFNAPIYASVPNTAANTGFIRPNAPIPTVYAQQNAPTTSIAASWSGAYSSATHVNANVMSGTQTAPPTRISSYPERSGMLNANQYAARHAVAKDLQPFSGKPEEWPMFISSYEGTSVACGFSDAENMLRLQRCLKGKALEAVQYRLMIPSSVPGVIETLRLMFGRPELIIQTLIQKVRSEPAPQADKLETLISFALSVQNLCGIMEASGLLAHICNPTLLLELTEKLPAQIKLNWAVYQQTTAAANLTTFSQWLFQLAQAASSVTGVSVNTTSAVKTEARTVKKGRVNAHAVSQSSSDIVADMTSLTRRQRWERVLAERLCRRCFGKHLVHKCESNSVCGQDGCKAIHHPLLHNDSPNKQLATNKPCHTHRTSAAGNILFRVVPVTLHGKTESLDTFAFLDEGSSITMLDEAAATILELDGTPEDLCLKWTADTVRVEQGSRRVSVDITGAPVGSPRYTLRNVRTVKSLSLPRQSMSSAELSLKYRHLEGVPLADYENATPRILIGMDNWKLGVPSQVLEGKWREPVATKTRLGWTVQGSYHHNEASDVDRNTIVHHSYHICDCTKDDQLHSMVREFFSIENFGVMTSDLALESAQESREKRLLESTTKYVTDRYETGLLWKYDEVTLPNSLPMAKRRWACLKKKMQMNADLARNLNEQIRDYVKKGYARKLTLEESNQRTPRTWYLPVFAVTNHNKPGKVRMVWDAAAKVNGVSLNSVLMKGPDQLTSLPFVLYGFRKGKIAICADIREMFHQVRIREVDQNSQRFLWGDHKGRLDPEEFVMQVMTFGATCSPSSAQYVKNINAKSFEKDLPRAVSAIVDHHYVDDLLDSVDTINEAVKLANDVISIHKKGGFEIRNWISNSAEVLELLKITPDENKKSLTCNPEAPVEKVLGMWWSMQLDAFTFTVAYGNLQREKDIIYGKRRPTKREVLRLLMSIFDPLGFLASFLVFVKILLQDIWRSSIQWDEQIGDKEYERWLQWIQLLPDVERVRIPRCYTCKIAPNEPKTIQLHIFVDASENAYAAVAYLRFSTEALVECALVGAKTKVAPQKPMSIPRLELQAAVLGCRLANSIIEGHGIEIQQRFMWSDSRTVLCWLKSDPRKYRQFVAFRIGEVLETSDIHDWRWIPTKMNVADEGTKWQRNPDFDPASRWFSGPEFLLQDQQHWPQEVADNITTDETEEIRASMKHTSMEQPITVNVEYFSKWNRLRQAQAFLTRSCAVILAKVKKQAVPTGSSTTAEFEAADNQLYRRAQFEFYAGEIDLLKDPSKMLEKSSPLYKLSPYLDELGVLRIRGRIDAASDVNADTKRPIILPRDHRVTELIIADYHAKFHHIHHESVLNEVHQKFYINGIRRLFKSIRFRCQQCRIDRATPNPPEMGALPRSRLASFTSPFTFTGVDCFGPIEVAFGRRVEKRWGVIFTCMTVRAIHVEVAHSLSADSFIITLRNFIARRGNPRVITCDNGTNFHGAANELRQALEGMESHCAPIGIEWRFNPPASPHMGGSWERLIGSVKKVLQQIMPLRKPTDELLRAMLMEAESIVNSRPLTFVPLEAEEDEALTPNHFLLGSSSGDKPPGEFYEKDLNLRKNWRKSQYLADSFWHKWVKAYLPTLTRRTKWFTRVKAIEVGDVVLIVDGNHPRNTWPKGRIIATQPGADGAVRMVTVQTAKGIYDRPAVKIAVLDVQRG